MSNFNRNTARNAPVAQSNQKVERQCASCGKMRGIYDFSATQRKKGDEAVCLKCIPEIQNVKPGHLSEEDDDSDAKYMDHITETKSTTAASSIRSGGVMLPAAFTASSASARLSAPSTRDTARVASSIGPSTMLSSSTNVNRPAPRPEVSASGFAKVKAGHRLENVPDLLDDDAEVVKDDQDEDEYDM